MSGNVKLDASTNGGRIEVARGQTVVVSLESNPTTGYSWELSKLDQDVLRQVGDSTYQSSHPHRLGSGGLQTFHFEAGNAGTTTLVLIYRRPWEKSLDPADTYTVEIGVR